MKLIVFQLPYGTLVLVGRFLPLSVWKWAIQMSFTWSFLEVSHESHQYFDICLEMIENMMSFHDLTESYTEQDALRILKSEHHPAVNEKSVEGISTSQPNYCICHFCPVMSWLLFVIPSSQEARQCICAASEVSVMSWRNSSRWMLKLTWLMPVGTFLWW